MGSIHLRALRNGLVAAVVTAVVGFALSGLFGSRHSPSDVDSPTPGPTQSCQPRAEPLDRAALKGLSGRFAGLWMDGPNDGWAVGWNGELDAEASPVLARWDGTTWIAATGVPGTKTVEVFDAVDGADAANVWAVGWSSDGFGRDSLALRYDGTSWEPSTSLPDTVLSGVRVLGPDDVWAVGSSGNPDLVDERAVALHWDGSTWTPAPLPVGGGRSSLAAISGTANDLWAVGYHHRGPLLVHYDGSGWERTLDVDAHGPLNGVSVRDGTVWIAGSSILRGDGASFSEVARAPKGGTLSAIAATSAGRAFAVGSVSTIDTSRSLAFAVEGEEARPIHVPATGTDGLNALAIVRGEAWAAGWHRTPKGYAPLLATLTGC